MSTKTRTQQHITYSLRETFPNNETVLHSGSFSTYEEAVDTIATWKLVPNSIRAIIKSTTTTVTTYEEEVLPL